MKLEQVQITGGATESIFPRVEKMLLGEGENDYQKALEYVAFRKKMGKYRSVIDFLFCELHPEWRMSCRRFYDGNGPRLVELVTIEQIVIFENRLIASLEVASDLFRRHQRASWRWYRNQFEMSLVA